MTVSDESAHQRILLATHLRRLLAIDEQLARKPGDVTLRLEREQTATGTEQAAARLGLGTFQHDLAAIVDAAELREAFLTSLQSQQQHLAAYQRAAELQRISADAVARIDIDQALASAGERLADVVRQLGDLGAPAARPPESSVRPAPESRTRPGDIYASYEHGLSELKQRVGSNSAAFADALLYEQRLTENITQTRRYGDTEARRADRSEIIDQLNALARKALGTSFNELCARRAPATPAPPHRPIDPPRGLSPDQARRLRDLLRRCDEHFDTNRDLRALFADQRLAAWRGGLPEAESLNARVDRLIDYLHDKRNTAGDQAILLLIQALAERYDAADARSRDLQSLANELRSPNQRAGAMPESAT